MINNRFFCFRSALVLLIALCSLHSFSQGNLIFRGNIHYPRILSNIWGYTDTATGKEYALVGEETGLDIVDISNPDAPQSLFFIPSDTSHWQEPKTWSHYVYITNENKGGLLIVNLAFLPDSAPYVRWSGVPNEDYQKSHTCFVDKNGILYLNGSNLFNRGSIMCDLKPNPMNPVYLGNYDVHYVHDCFARNDTLYTAEILDHQFSVIDVRDKANPVVLATQTTPFLNSHNVWLSDDGKYLFNTDEAKFAPVTAYDISNLQNITEIDQYRHSDYDSSVVHNTYYRDGYIYTSYYHNGVTIADAHRPGNIVEVAIYDTSPFPPGNGYSGCWGVYCFFPSGNIVCSDRQEGMFVLTPTLKRACYLEGNVTDSQTGNPVQGVTVEIIGKERLKVTDIGGNYQTGVADSGNYDVRFTDRGVHCLTRIVSGVNLSPGNVTMLNQTVSCSFPSSVEEVDEMFSFAAQPNVFSNSTQITFHSPQESNSVISLFDASGKMMKQFNIETPNAEIVLGEDLSSGVYFLQAMQNNYSKSLRLVKTR